MGVQGRFWGCKLFRWARKGDSDLLGTGVVGSTTQRTVLAGPTQPSSMKVVGTDCILDQKNHQDSPSICMCPL